MNNGKVFFVGAGPGDPKLITVKGLELIRQADVIIYDRLANPGLLAHAKEKAKLIFCGKESARHTMPQEEINQCIVQEARKGQRVLRLKGGDPCVFGRVGEEIEECLKHEIPFEIVPGITSGIAAPAYAGIPLTHRDYNSSVAFVTGHRCAKNENVQADWQSLSGVDTLVIYMGVKNLLYIQEQLLHFGKNPTTPVALVKWGTTSRQETLVGELQDIAEKAKLAQFGSPAIIIIGDVVKLRDTMRWHDLPSADTTENTLIFSQDKGLVDEHLDSLLALGAEIKGVRCFASPTEPEWLEPSLFDNIEQYDWIYFTSPDQVALFFHQLRRLKIDIRRLHARFVTNHEEAQLMLEERGIMAENVQESQLLEMHSHSAVL